MLKVHGDMLLNLLLMSTIAKREHVAVLYSTAFYFILFIIIIDPDRRRSPSWAQIASTEYVTMCAPFNPRCAGHALARSQAESMR